MTEPRTKEQMHAEACAAVAIFEAEINNLNAQIEAIREKKREVAAQLDMAAKVVVATRPANPIPPVKLGG